MKKLFGGIDLTWKKLIIFALIAAVYTATMAIIPITKDTSFRDIAATFEWWILFGVIIICNSKSPLDSSLKCFVFFLISQPLIYLLQVPFSWQGWGLFSYYKYWFIWTILTIPMGYVGYYIKKDNWLSALILLPMLLLLAFTGLGFLSGLFESFPNHLLSCIICFAFVFVLVFGVLKKTKLRAVSLILVILGVGAYLFYTGGFREEYDIYYSLENYTLNGEVSVSAFSGTSKGHVLVRNTGDYYVLTLNGRKGAEYRFTITDENHVDHTFEYYFDKENNTVIVNEMKETE